MMENRWTNMASAFLLSFALTACHKPISGTINCYDIATYTSTYGQLNTIQASLGDIYFVNEKDKYLGYVFHEQTDSTDYSIDKNVNKLIIDADIDLQVNLQTQDSKIKLLSAQLEERLERNTQLVLRNPQRLRLLKPYALLRKIENENIDIFERFADKQQLFMLVSSIVLADSIALKVSNLDSTSAGVKTLNVDGINFKLSSDCDALIDVEGKAAAVFFKSVFFKYDSPTRKLIPQTQLFDLKTYHVNTLNQ